MMKSNLRSTTACLLVGMAISVSASASAQTPQKKQSPGGGSLLAKPLLNDAAPSFQKQGNNYVHWLSKINCPSSVADVPLIQRVQYYIQGHSAKCRYSDSRTMRTDIAFRIVEKGETPDSLVRGIVARIDKAEKVIRKSPAQRATVKFGGDALACVKTDITMQASRGNGTVAETVMACIKNDWIFQILERGSVTSETARAKFRNEFMAKQFASNAHLNACTKSREDRIAMKPSAATGLNIAVDRFGYTEKGAPCFAGNIGKKPSKKALLMIAWPNNPDTPLSLHNVADNGIVDRAPHFRLQDMWAGLAAAKRGPGGYIMIQEDKDGTLSSFGGFLKIVSPGRVYDSYRKVQSGELKPRTVSKPAKGGGKNITIG